MTKALLDHTNQLVTPHSLPKKPHREYWIVQDIRAVSGATEYTRRRSLIPTHCWALCHPAGCNILPQTPEIRPGVTDPWTTLVTL